MWIIIILCIIWYLIGSISYIYLMRYKERVDVADILTGISLMGLLGLISLHLSLKRFKDYNIFKQVVFMPILKKEEKK